MPAGVLREVCCCNFSFVSFYNKICHYVFKKMKSLRFTAIFALIAGTCVTAFAQGNSEVIGSGLNETLQF